MYQTKLLVASQSDLLSVHPTRRIVAITKLVLLGGQKTTGLDTCFNNVHLGFKRNDQQQFHFSHEISERCSDSTDLITFLS